MKLITPLLLAGAALAAPSHSDSCENVTPPCASAFDGWSLTGLEYHASYIFTTPAHQNSWGYFNFQLSNPALNYVVDCHASSTLINDFFYGETTYNCPTPEGSGGEVTFTFNRPSGLVTLNQTWVCHDDASTTVHAGGSATVNLVCADETTLNPDWKQGDIYSDREVKCDPVTLPITASWISGAA